MSTCCTTQPAPRVKHAAALATLYQALADPTRLRVLAILADAPGGELCVCHIHGGLAISQPTVSRHLATLRRAGLVAARRDGIWMHYRIARPDDPVLAAVVDAALHALGHVDGTTRDRTRTARVVESAPTPAA
jgi:ArsR family transcriptional regulator